MQHNLIHIISPKEIPSIHVAPASSKSLLASNFKSEPTEIHLCKIVENMTKASKQVNSTSIARH
jgi:hypothetical protein